MIRTRLAALEAALLLCTSIATCTHAPFTVRQTMKDSLRVALTAAWLWCTGPFTVERPVHRLSLTKILATGFAIIDAIVMVGGTMNGYTVTLAIACIAAAMGKQPFTTFLGRWSSSTTLTDARTLTRTEGRTETVVPHEWKDGKEEGVV